MIGDGNGPDPFLRFPESTSLLEKKLLHFLMMRAPQLLFGARPKAAFDYTWDIAMPNFTAGYELMSWATIPAAKMWNLLTASLSEDWFLRRRARNYRLLRQMLDKQDYDGDYRISCLATAGYIEGSEGNLSTSLVHMKAALILIKQQDEGLRRIQTMQPIFGTHLLTTAGIIGLPMFFDILTSLEDALTHVMHNLIMLQAWNKVIREDEKDHDHVQNPRNRSQSYRDVIKHIPTSPERHQYWTTRRQSLGVKPLLDYLQNNDLPDGQDHEWRSRLTTLYLLNSILKNLDGDETVANGLLLDLEVMIIKSMDENAPRVVYSFISMIAACTQRLGLWVYNGPESPLPPVRAWEAISFAEVIMLASREVRQRVMKVMFHWLYDGPENLRDSVVLGEAELLMFELNISGNWEAKPKPD